MKLKQRVEDFRVRELLLEAPSTERQHFRVYRVTKRKLTSIDAARRLAQEVGVPPGEVSMAGLKDRQGVTIQHMAVHHGPVVSVKEPDLRIEAIGYRAEALTSRDSAGNAFEVVVRGLDSEQLAEMRTNMSLVRDGGVVNYFDDQRFGNLKHGQGWIALDLMHGQNERALRALLTSTSLGDDPRRLAFKRAMAASWGNWQECRDIAGRFGEHHSLFEHLKRDPEDFAGAFQHIATRLRLIHMYAFQSHMWNRAVAELVRSRTPVEKRVIVKSLEGPLVFPETTAALKDYETFRIPGPKLEDVQDETQRGLLEDALATERLVAADFEIEGIPGFGLKGEDRPLVVRPAHLRVRPAEPDTINRGLRMVRVRFELPRGAYATLLVKRLLGRAVEEGTQQRDAQREHAGREGEPAGAGAERGGRGYRGDRNERGDRGAQFSDGRGPRSERPRSERPRRDHQGGPPAFAPHARGGRDGRDGRQRDTREFTPRGHDPRGGRPAGEFGARRDPRDSRDSRYRGERSDGPGSRQPIQSTGRPGAWRPGHGLSGDEPRDRDRAQGGSGRDDRGPRREYGGGDRGGTGGRDQRSGGGARRDHDGRGRDDRFRGGDRGGDRGGRGPAGGRPWEANRGGGRDDSRPGRDARPGGDWRPQRSGGTGGQGAPGRGRDYDDAANWGERQDALGSGPHARDAGRAGRDGGRGRDAGQGRDYRGRDDRGRAGAGGGRSYDRRPSGGSDHRRPERGGRDARTPERGGWQPQPRGGSGDRDRRPGSREGQRPDRGGGGSGAWGGARPGNRDDRPQRGGSDGGRPAWRPGGRDGGAPRPERGGDRSRDARRPYGSGGERGGSSWGSGRPREDRGSSQRGGPRPTSDRKPSGWGEDRARHVHKRPDGGASRNDPKSADRGAERPRYDPKERKEVDQERTPDA